MNIEGLESLYIEFCKCIKLQQDYLDPNNDPKNHPAEYHFSYGMTDKFKLRGDTKLSAMKVFCDLYEQNEEKVKNKFSYVKEILKYSSDKKSLIIGNESKPAGFYCYKV